VGVKRPGRETDNSPPSKAEVKNAWSYTSTPNTPLWCGARLKHRDNFTFTLKSVYAILNFLLQYHKHKIFCLANGSSVIGVWERDVVTLSFRKETALWYPLILPL
jgi:hypothetical protein